MENKVRVFGRAQNRTALGIANAYLAMYPHATLEDLNKAFPGTLNSSKLGEAIFVDVKKAAELGDHAKFEMFFFEKKDELLHLSDGRNVAMAEMWKKDDFEKLISWAKQYGVEIADYKPKEGFRKGGFELEYLNGYIPPVPEKAKSKTWLYLLLGAIIILILLFLLFFRSCGAEPEVKVVTVVDTVYVRQVEQIEAKFNAAKFEQGSSSLTDDAKFVLHDLEKVLKEQSGLKLRLVGHTSQEGDAAYNQRLSEERAKAAVDFLISRGIDASRLQYEGKGSSQPLDEANQELNRRTEFIIVE